MTRTTICLATAVVALSLGGCIGDRAADRTLTIHQMQATGTYIGQFQIDVSQLPPDAIEGRIDSGQQGDPLTKLTINYRYPIRIVLVPATENKPSPQNPTPQTKQ